MKRFHIHVAVSDLEKSVRFYSAIFGSTPTVLKSDYAKWMLEDPRINFAISERTSRAGLDHLGMQAESAAELEEIHARLRQADGEIAQEKDAHCCYARSDKYWVRDPSGIAWESFHSLATIPIYGADPVDSPVDARANGCCVPAAPEARSDSDRQCCNA